MPAPGRHTARGRARAGRRERRSGRGARVYERSRVRRLASAPGGVTAETAGGARVRARAAVLTEPVPDVLEELGWTGGEGIGDGRVSVHYTRTTRDGRILLCAAPRALGIHLAR